MTFIIIFYVIYRLLSYPMSIFIKVNLFGSKIFIMYLAVVVTHEITVFNQSHRIAAKIPLRPTWIVYRLGTKDANNSILFLEQFLVNFFSTLYYTII